MSNQTLIRKNLLCQLGLACVIIASAVQIIANLCNEIALVKNSSILPFIFRQDEAAVVTIANTSILLASYNEGSHNMGLPYSHMAGNKTCT